MRNDAEIAVECGSSDEHNLPETFVDYNPTPREYTLNSISTIVDIHTRVSDLYSHPHDQIREQLRLAVEKVKERQEGELINNADYGLLNQATAGFRVATRKGAPTPDDLDELLAKIWKEPAFFLAHPRAIAAFGRECTRRGVPPPTTSIFGSPFITWRGVPLVPSDKLAVSDSGKTNILLLRTGEKRQGVIGLFQPGLPGEQTPGLSVRFMGINKQSIASYLISLYCSAAVLAEDALGVLENVESATTMSTSDLDAVARNPAVRVPDPNTLDEASPFPLAEIAEMANVFFRSLPGQQPASLAGQPLPSAGALPSPGMSGLGVTGPSLAAIAPPPPVPAAAPSLMQGSGFVPGAPQFGLPLPGVPSLPAADKIPSEAELIRLAAEAGAPAGSGVNAPPASTVPGIPGAQSLSSSALSSPGSTPAAVTGPGNVSAPVLVPDIPVATAPVQATTIGLPSFGMPLSGTNWPGASLSGAGASPFALPLPLSLSDVNANLLNPSELDFDAALPAIPGLPEYASEEEAAALARAATSFYFLEDAGTLLKRGGTVPAPASEYRPELLGDLKLDRNQFDLGSVRRDFPILDEKVNGKPLVWLDNAATTQKPRSVIDRITWFYEHENSNVHRAAHELAARSTDAYEDARQKVARFLKAPSAKEIVFVRGATEGINLIAKSWGKRHVQKGDEIIVSTIEHHANIVPWQQLCAECGAVLRVIPVDDDGQILLDEYEKLLNPRTRLVSVAQVSNALGTILPTHAIVSAAHRYGARVLIDGAQSVSHMRTDVQALDCDFFVFSGHKVFGPTGIGAVYGKPDALAEAPPWQGGGNMIVDVTFEKTVYQPPPGRFEAGTGNIADAVGLGAAIDYVQAIGIENIARHEHELLVYATQGLKTIPGLRLIGTAKEKAAVLSFVLEGFQTEEVGSALNREGIAVRSGHHCAQPSLRRFGVETTVRPSLALYNNYEDLDALIAALRRLKSVGAR